MSPMTSLTFWFEFASPYSYLSAMRIEDLAEQAGVSVTWQPFMLGPIFAAQGWDRSPFLIYEAKGRNILRDWERQAEAHGLPPYVQPKNFPNNGLLAARVANLALKYPLGRDFCRAVYHAQFAEGALPSDPEVIRTCLMQSGLPENLLEAAADPDNKAAMHAATRAAMAAGIFGAPSFTVGDELFWGDDRLEQALDWARRGA